MKNVSQISSERWTKESDLVSVEWIAMRLDMKWRHHLICGLHQNMRLVLYYSEIRHIWKNRWYKRPNTSSVNHLWSSLMDPFSISKSIWVTQCGPSLEFSFQTTENKSSFAYRCIFPNFDHFLQLRFVKLTTTYMLHVLSYFY